MKESLLTFHNANFCKFHVLYACKGDTCAFKTREWFETEREKKKESRNLNPGLTAWVKKYYTPSSVAAVDLGAAVRVHPDATGPVVDASPDHMN